MVLLPEKPRWATFLHVVSADFGANWRLAGGGRYVLWRVSGFTNDFGFRGCSGYAGSWCCAARAIWATASGWGRSRGDWGWCVGFAAHL